MLSIQLLSRLVIFIVLTHSPSSSPRPYYPLFHRARECGHRLPCSRGHKTFAEYVRAVDHIVYDDSHRVRENTD